MHDELWFCDVYNSFILFCSIHFISTVLSLPPALASLLLLRSPPPPFSPFADASGGVINGSYHSGPMLARARAATLKGGL